MINFLAISLAIGVRQGDYGTIDLESSNSHRRAKKQLGNNLKKKEHVENIKKKGSPKTGSQSNHRNAESGRLPDGDRSNR